MWPFFLHFLNKHRQTRENLNANIMHGDFTLLLGAFVQTGRRRIQVCSINRTFSSAYKLIYTKHYVSSVNKRWGHEYSVTEKIILFVSGLCGGKYLCFIMMHVIYCAKIHRFSRTEVLTANYTSYRWRLHQYHRYWYWSCRNKQEVFFFLGWTTRCCPGILSSPLLHDRTLLFRSVVNKLLGRLW